MLVAAGAFASTDCDTDGVLDSCELDCGAPGGACDVPGCGLESDCDGDLVPDSCQLAAAAAGCSFPSSLVFNGTTTTDDVYVGPPDDIYFGIGGQVVTWDVGCGFVVDGPGADLTLYEVDTGGPEFGIFDLQVSLDGVQFVSVTSSVSVPIAIPGDSANGNRTFARSYDLAGSGLSAARFVRIDGNGTGSSGAGSGFDLDAIGFVHTVSDDCDSSGLLDQCEAFQDCNANGVPESCELAAGAIDDCNSNGTADSCDTLGGVGDCDGDAVPDICEADCNGNSIADDCDLSAMTSGDCNANGVPDECDLTATQAVIEPVFAEATTQLVFYEDFETPDIGNFTTYVEGESIVTSATTWLVTTTGVDLYEATVRVEAAAADGTQAIDLTGSPGAGVIETTIPTLPGQPYELAFEYARNNLLGAVIGEAQVEVVGGVVLLLAEFQHDPALHPFDEYLPYRGRFVADATQVVLRFSSLNPGNTGITLDAVSLSELSLGGVPSSVGAGFAPATSAGMPFAAAGDLTMIMTANSDLGATNEFIDIEVNNVPLARLFEFDGLQCLEGSSQATIAADDFNLAVAGGMATLELVASGSVNAFECARSDASFSLSYVPIVDCNDNGTLDQCDISGATSTDLNLNGIADDCELDCNLNSLPDDYEIAQGFVPDCNANGIPDGCDVAVGGTSADCNADLIPDECQLDCNGNGIADDCDLTAATSDDCNVNSVPDECDLAVGSGGCAFPQLMLDNATTAADSVFLGAPDGVYFGLGGQIVTYELDCGFVVDGPGVDLTVYEVSTGSQEFGSLADVLVSSDGVNFFSVKATESPVVRIPGDQTHTNDNFARSYDLDATPLNAIRFVRLDGAGTGSSGTGTGFDLDAIGAIQRAGVDCDGSGTLDSCETFSDCNGNLLNDVCEQTLGVDDDCNMNGQIDACDIDGGAPDVDFDEIPDSCEADCDGNAVPDHYEIEQGIDSDCNDNTVPDDCDLAAATSEDCNADLIPDECPVCPTVEVVFIMDTSSSMSDEGSALCANLQQVVAELQADLVNVETELLGMLSTGGSTFSCLTDTVGNLYGTAVPGTPPVGQEILGEPCGVNLNEDWAPATAIVAGLRNWQPDSVRLIVPISDEGPRCGDPVTDPGSDRDAILHAIGQAAQNDVIVSPIAGSGSSAGVIAMANLIAGATGGTTFETSDPDLDLAQGITDILEGACFARGDCNGNLIPDQCDLNAMTSQDCDMSGRPDECEDDCNGNGLADSCDIAAMTSDDDNGNTVPDECEGIVLTADTLNWNWTAVMSALGYDLLRGDLVALRGTTGDFTLSTEECLVNDHTQLDWPVGVDPLAGEAYWYLVRALLPTGNLTYDGFGTGQVQGRDPGIDASPVACP
jgi:hypothetical protein